MPTSVHSSRRTFMTASVIRLAGDLATFPLAALADEPGRDWATQSPGDVGVDPLALQSLLDNAQNLRALRSVLVVRDGALIAERYYGKAAIADLQPINSATKSVASMLVGIALQQGKMGSLSDTIDQLLPSAAGMAPGTPVHTITLEQILTGTSRLRYDFRTQLRDLDAADDPVAYALALPVAGTGPSPRWHYNDAAVSLLSPILRHAQGLPVEQLVQRDLFSPLGIDRLAVERDKTGNVMSYRGLRLRARDFAKIAWTMANGGRWGTAQIVPAAWVEASTRFHVATSWSAGPIAPAGYGYLWFTGRLGGQPVAWAWGYGAQLALIAPALRLAVVTTASNPGPTELATQTDAVMGVVASILALAK